MINAQNAEIDIVYEREWLAEHKSAHGLSWTDLSKATGIPTGTISQFGNGNYKGDNDKLARQVLQYRQTLHSQQQLSIEAPELPPYFDTPTSRSLMGMLEWAYRGRLVICAGGAGLGKTTTAREFSERSSNVWLVTVSPQMNSLSKLLTAVKEATGHVIVGGPSGYTKLLRRLRESKGLLIFDDAQHLSIPQLEEIRSWYDQAGVGIALFGNIKVASQMEGGTRQAEFAQLFSRVGMKMIRHVPLQDDVEILLDEWKVEQSNVRKFVHGIGTKPGGLRSATFALEIATMLAGGRDKELHIEHITAAWTQLSSRPAAA